MSQPPSLDPLLAARIQAFVADHGEGALESLLDSAHLVHTEMRPLSKLALRHSRDYADAGLPHSLVIQVDPNAKLPANRVQARLITGRVALGVDFGSVGGPA